MTKYEVLYERSYQMPDGCFLFDTRRSLRHKRAHEERTLVVVDNRGGHMEHAANGEGSDA